MSDEYTYEDAREFSEHPVKAYDPFYTRDFAMFDYHFDLFTKFLIKSLRGIIHSIELGEIDPDSLATRREISNLYAMRHNVEVKCNAYAYHTGINLISRTNSL